MRVVVLDTGRGIDATKVALWRTQLGLEDMDEMSLVSWFPPRVHLPLASHLVCGPELHVGREPREWPVANAGELQADALGQEPSEDAASDEQGADAVVAGGDDAGMGAFELDEQLTEHEGDPSQAAAADRGPVDGDPGQVDAEDDHEDAPGADVAEVASTAGGAAPPVLPTNLSHLPVYHPRRMRQAVRWRRKKAQRRASRFTSRQVRRARSVAVGTLHLPTTAARSALRTRKDAISWEFALATTRSQMVDELFRTADVVVPVDQRSHKAAWLLTRRHAGPDVMVTLPAAARALAVRRPSAEDRSGAVHP